MPCCWAARPAESAISAKPPIPITVDGGVVGSAISESFSASARVQRLGIGNVNSSKDTNADAKFTGFAKRARSTKAHKQLEPVTRPPQASEQILGNQKDHTSHKSKLQQTFDRSQEQTNEHRHTCRKGFTSLLANPGTCWLVLTLAS